MSRPILLLTCFTTVPTNLTSSALFQTSIAAYPTIAKKNFTIYLLEPQRLSFISIVIQLEQKPLNLVPSLQHPYDTIYHRSFFYLDVDIWLYIQRYVIFKYIDILSLHSITISRINDSTSSQVESLSTLSSTTLSLLHGTILTSCRTDSIVFIYAR